MYTEGLILSDETNSCAFECEFPVFPVIVENIPLFVMRAHALLLTRTCAVTCDMANISHQDHDR